MIDISLNMSDFLQNLELEVNNFGFKTDDAVNKINKQDLQDVCVIASICCIHLAYTYAKCEHFDHWDDRNRASSEWSYKHKDDFLNLFQGLTGSEFPWKPAEHREERYFLGDIAAKELSENIRKGITRWTQCHPTLQQRMIGVFGKVLVKANAEGFTEDDVHFPYI